jgi:hypothetical protein
VVLDICAADLCCRRPRPILSLALRSLATSVGTPDWGDVPTWLEAVFTSIAFMTAAVALTLELDDRRARQAALVAAWAEPLDALDGTGSVRLRNASTLPVYDLTVLMGVKVSPYGSSEFRHGNETAQRPLLAPSDAGEVEDFYLSFWPDLTAGSLSTCGKRTWSCNSGTPRVSNGGETTAAG